MYQWARALAIRTGSVAIAASQISADGDGLTYPTLGMLKDSKTGKQGAADVIITLGASNDPTLAGSRYVGLTKNKRRVTGVRGSLNAEVIFDRDRCDFKEGPN
jgi:replicative DNA helicase